MLTRRKPTDDASIHAPRTPRRGLLSGAGGAARLARWPIRQAIARHTALGEEPGEIAAGDLARGPPEAGARDAGRCATQRPRDRAVVVEVAPKVERRLAGEHDAAQDAPEWLRSDRGASLGGDHLRCGVGLLG